MEKIILENMERQIREMWDAISHIPANDPDKQAAFDQAAKSENSLREAYRKQEALLDAAPELLYALKETHIMLVAYAKKVGYTTSVITRISGNDILFEKVEGGE